MCSFRERFFPINLIAGAFSTALVTAFVMTALGLVAGCTRSMPLNHSSGAVPSTQTPVAPIQVPDGATDLPSSDTVLALPDPAPDSANARRCWSRAGLAAADVGGGDTGPFVREVTRAGIKSIEGCVKIPPLENFGQQDEYTRNPYLYFGFNLPNGQNGELGLMFQDRSRFATQGFTPYIRRPSITQGAPRFTFFGKSNDETRRYRFHEGDTVCLRASYAASVLKLEILPQTKIASDESGAQIAQLISRSGNAITAGFTPSTAATSTYAGGRIAPSQIRFRRMTAIATAINGVESGSFDSAEQLKDTRLDVYWSQAKTTDIDGNSQPLSQSIDYDFGNDDRCTATVRWPGSAAIVDRCPGNVDLISIRGPDTVGEPAGCPPKSP